jgi:hypothetical protein
LKQPFKLLGIFQIVFSDAHHTVQLRLLAGVAHSARVLAKGKPVPFYNFLKV